MTKNVVWIHTIGKGDIAVAGGKGANLGEMVQVGFPVPPAFVVTAQAYADFVKGTGLAQQISAVLKAVNPDDNRALHEASEKIRKLFTSTKLPDHLAQEVREAYKSLGQGQEAFVAVRSSATAEDLPEASFAGQQDTFLNCKGDADVLQKILRCWSSLFTPRAIFYRAKQHFDHDKVNIAVVVQKMVNADKAGVLFTRHPTTGKEQLIIEGALGLGEGVVSGTVSPDNYLVAPNGDVLQVTVATQDTMVIRGPDGKTQTVKVPADKRDLRVVSDDELKLLARVGKQIEKHYGTPQDIEWAFEAGELYVLQTRPITTIRGNGLSAPVAQQAGAQPKTAHEGASGPLLKGLGAAPGIATGKVVMLKDASELNRVHQGDILVTPMTMPDMVPAMKRAAAIVTDEGGMTCHAAIVSRELGIPCVVGTRRGDNAATRTLKEGMLVTVDGEKGTVHEGALKVAKPHPALAQQAAKADHAGAPAPTLNMAAAKPLTATQVKVNISMPEAIDRAMAVDPDGVGLLRIEHIVLAFDEDYLGLPRSGRGEDGTNYPKPVHPAWAIANGHRAKYVQFLADNFERIVGPMDPRTVWIRTLDFPTDEMKKARGGEDEPHEHNPMLGWRGVRRGLEQEELLLAEFEAIAKLVQSGRKNVGVMLPLVQHPKEVRRSKELARQAGLRPHQDVQWGIMVEIPAAAIIIDLLLDEGLDFVSFGTNDLTQYTLAVDRNSQNVAHLYDEFHPAVARLIESTIKVAKARGCETSICGQAGSNPKFVEKLVKWGITSVSANIDALVRVRETVARTEQKLLLERAREGC